jgi:stress response protein YsnF
VIERKPGDGAAATTDVNKRPVVREEVNIRKQEHEDMKQVSENVGREELDIDTSGDAHVEDLRDNDRNKHDRS